MPGRPGRREPYSRAGLLNGHGRRAWLLACLILITASPPLGAAVYPSPVAVNSADDLINPPELGILEQGIKRVTRGRAVVIPFREHTRGHGSHTITVSWKQYLQELLQESE